MFNTVKILKTTLFIAAFFFPIALQCQAPDPSPAAEETLKKSNTDNAIEVVVTASRGTEQSSLEIPQSIESVQREQIDDGAYQDVQDAIHTLPNVAMSPREGSPSFWQEGFIIRGLGGQRVLTLTDGVRQSGQGIGYGGGNLSLYDLYSIERIEILRGPASVLYGPDAFGGVVNIISREPKRRSEWGINGGAQYMYNGANDLNRMGTYVDFGDEDSSNILSASFNHANDVHLPDGEDSNNGAYKSWDISGKSDYYFCDDTRLRILGSWNRNLDVRIMDESAVLPIAMFPPPGSQSPITIPIDFKFPVYQRSMFGTELETRNISSEIESLKTAIHWQQIHRSFMRSTGYYTTGSPGFAGPPLFIDPRASVAVSTFHTNDLVNSFEWANQGRLHFGEHKAILGVDVAYDNSYLPETDTEQVIAVAGRGSVVMPPFDLIKRVRADADQYRLGIYAEDTWDAGLVDLKPGVRLDYSHVSNQQTDFSSDPVGFSASLGATHYLTKQDSLYSSLASGYRAPDIGERFQDGITNLGVPNRIIGKEDIDPERAWTMEGGYKRRSSKSEISLAVFATKVQRYIGTKSLGVIQGVYTEQYDNLGTVDFWGSELEGAYHFSDFCKFNLAIGRTWTDSADKVNVPNWIFNYGPSFVIPVNEMWLKDINTGVYLRTALKSKEEFHRLGRESFEGASFTTLDWKVSMQLGDTLFGKGKLVSGIENLLNRKYKEPFYNMYQPGRSGYVGLQFDF